MVILNPEMIGNIYNKAVGTFRHRRPILIMIRQIYRSFLFRIFGIFSVYFICKIMVASAVKVCDSVLYHLNRDGIIEDLHCLVD